MIRIGFISALAYNYFFPGNIKQAGGHTRIVHLARKLATIPGFEVSCITGDFGQPDVVEKDGVRLVKSDISNTFAFFSVARKLKKLDLDIYVDVYASPRLFLLYLMKKMFGIKYVFMTGSDADVDGSYRNVENSFYYAAYLKGLHNADAIISQTPKHVSLLRKKYGLHSELILSPYFDIKPSNVSKKNKETIIWIGRAASYKRPWLFIDLVKQFPDQKFVMICNHSDYDDDGFMDHMEQHGHEYKNLEFTDYAENDEVHKMLDKAMILVNTSDFEGFPNTFIEAAMHRTPIFSLNSNPNRMLTAHNGGKYCHGDMNVLFKTVSKAIESKIDIDTSGECAYSYAVKNHQISMAVIKFLAVSKKLMFFPYRRS